MHEIAVTTFTATIHETSLLQFGDKLSDLTMVILASQQRPDQLCLPLPV
jgi:hypothetical protein